MSTNTTPPTAPDVEPSDSLLAETADIVDEWVRYGIEAANWIDGLTAETPPIMSLSITSGDGVHFITVHEREVRGYEVREHGEVMSISPVAYSPAIFARAEQAMTFALHNAGWRVDAVSTGLIARVSGVGSPA